MKKFLIALFIFTAIFTFTFSSQAQQVHRVNSGENLYSIAQEYGVTVNEIINTNHLRNPDQIYNREVLIIPEASSSYFYRVQPGDSLYKISLKLGIPVQVLASSNYLNISDELYINQVIYIPFRFRFPQEYQVKQGDTLYSIAQSFGITVNEITALNRLNNQGLVANQRLKIPVNNYSPQPGYQGPQYSVLFPTTFYLKGNTGDYKIALTFDDGPDNLYTPMVLDILKKYNVPATFFLMGKRVENNPEIVKRILQAGHIIGNHSWSHIAFTKISRARVEEETSSTEKLIADITGKNTSLLRLPEGAISVDVVNELKDMGYKVIHWSVDSRDWLDRDVDQILINTLPNVQKDSIVLFHSAGGENQDLSPTIKSLPEFIETMQMRGYKFVSLTELLNTPAYK